MKSLLRLTNQPKARHSNLSTFRETANIRKIVFETLTLEAVREVLFIIHDQQWRDYAIFWCVLEYFEIEAWFCLTLGRELFSTNAAIFNLERQFSWNSKFF